MMINKLLWCLVCAVLVVSSVRAENADEVPFVEGSAPPAATPGEGWCLVTRPATYKTVTEEVLIRPATFFMEAVPAKYETKEETVMVAPETKRATVVPAKFKTETFQQLVKPESTTYTVVPAVYECAEETVCVKAACEQLVASPATYKQTSEQVLVSPAHTFWKKVGCDGKVDKREANGECYCMCEVPAKYVTICKQVLDKDAASEKVASAPVMKTIKVNKLVKDAEVKKTVVPAEYVTLERTVIDTPATVSYETVPAKFETIQKEVEVTPASTRKVEIPAKYETTSRQVLDQPSRMVWKRTKCDCGDIVKKYKEIPGTDEASLLKMAKVK